MGWSRAVVTAFLLYPLAALHLTPRILARLARTLTPKKAPCDCPDGRAQTLFPEIKES